MFIELTLDSAIYSDDSFLFDAGAIDEGKILINMRIIKAIKRSSWGSELFLDLDNRDTSLCVNEQPQEILEKIKIEEGKWI